MNSKGQIYVSLNFNYKVNFKEIYTKLCMCIKDIEHIEHNVYSVAWAISQGRDFGVLGINNLNVGICDGAPSTARSSYRIIVSCLFFIFLLNQSFEQFQIRQGILSSLEPDQGPHCLKRL